MLIVNADDLGRNRLATDSIIECHAEKRINATSGMVFMEDSERAAGLARASQIDVGLHINFTESFTGPSIPESLRRSHERIRKFLRASKYALLVYNPFLRKAFREVFEAQVREFTRLYGRQPSRFDGHQHMHLCSNMILDRILPADATVRRSFSFGPGEKSFFNRKYRSVIDRQLAKRHRITNFFFALSSHLNSDKLENVVALGRLKDVELMTHTWNKVEFDWLMSRVFTESMHNAGCLAPARCGQHVE